jgi:hypothetical protein
MHRNGDAGKPCAAETRLVERVNRDVQDGWHIPGLLQEAEGLGDPGWLVAELIAGDQ